MRMGNLEPQDKKDNILPASRGLHQRTGREKPAMKEKGKLKTLFIHTESQKNIIFHFKHVLK